MTSYSGKFRLFQLSDFPKLPAMRWFIQNLVPRYGITLLYGEPKEAGKKTFAGISMACAIATATDWCGFATTKGTVLYIGGEGFYGLLRRQAAWEQLHGVKAGNGLRFLRVPINFFDKDEVKAALTALQAQGFKPDFVVIDTLARSMSGGKENATEDMSTVFELMDFFRARLVDEQLQENWSDAGILIIHHTGKDGLNYRGSSVIKGAVDALIMAKAHDLEIKLISKGYKDAPDFKTFSVYCESTNVETEDGPENVLAVKGLISVDAVAEMKEEEDAKKAEHNLLLMITVLRKFLGNKATNKDWNKEMLAYGNAGWSERSFSRRLNILKARKWVNVLGNGAFARTTEGALYEATKLAPEIEEDKTHTTAAQNHGHQTTATPYKGGGGHASRGSGLDDDAPRHRQQTTAIGSGGSGSTNTTTATTESGDGSGYGAEAAAKRAKELLERLKRKPNVA